MAGGDGAEKYNPKDGLPESPIVEPRADSLLLFGRWLYENRPNNMSAEVFAAHCERSAEWAAGVHGGEIVPTTAALNKIREVMKVSVESRDRPVDVLVRLNVDPWSQESTGLRERTNSAPLSVRPNTLPIPQNDGKPLVPFFGVKLRDKLLTIWPLTLVSAAGLLFFIEHPWDNDHWSFWKVDREVLAPIATALLAFIALSLHSLGKGIDTLVWLRRQAPWNKTLWTNYENIERLRNEEHRPRPSSQTGDGAGSTSKWKRLIPPWNTGVTSWFLVEDCPFLLPRYATRYMDKAIETDMAERVAVVFNFLVLLFALGSVFTLDATGRSFLDIVRALNNSFFPSIHDKAIAQFLVWAIMTLLALGFAVYYHLRLNTLSRATYTRLFSGYGKVRS